jgi:plastocyanin
VTNASGIATTSWTLGQGAGAQSATASLSGATGSPVSFSATATAGAAAALVKAGGDSASSPPNTSLVIQVLSTDGFGNPVAGVPVTWAVSSGPATVNPKVDTTSTGGAQTTVQIGATTGAIVITATSSGLTGSPITFRETSASGAASAAVAVGDDFFKSGHNSSQNPAVDTIAVGGKVTWTWGGANNHSVQSTGSPSFTSSSVQSSGTYSLTFNTAGTYTYDCAVHGTAMTGKVVVQ